MIIDKRRVKSFGNYSPWEGKLNKRWAPKVSATDPRARNKNPISREGTIEPAQSRPYDGGGSEVTKTAEAAASPTVAADPLAPSLIRRQ